jgi:hypothetical protein
MSSDAIALASLCLAMLGILVGFVWRAAVTATSHELRIKNLEDDGRRTADGLSKQIKELEGVINQLRDTVWDLSTRLKVNAARASQGQFGDDTDRPPR